MEIIIQHPQPKPILGVCFPEIFFSTYKILHLKPQSRTSLGLLKYFPKHIHSLPFNLSNLKTRIKHLKLVKKIPTDHPNNILRVLLQNKRKNVKFAAGVEDQGYKEGYNKQTLGFLKMFPNIQKVEFCVGVQYEENARDRKDQEKQGYWIDRMSNYLNRMTNIKSLYLSNHGSYLLPLLSKLNSFETMLSRLNVFNLNFVLFNRPEDSPHARAILNFKTVLKYLTHLNLDLPVEKDFFEVFQLLPDYCPRLISLVTFIKQRNSVSNIEEVGYLQCLQHFQNLQQLSLSCHFKLDAFRYCKFPTSLRFLDLYFIAADWQSLMTKEAFSHKREGLESLEKLQIFLLHYHPIEEEEMIKDFIKDLLSRILTLKEFTMELLPKHLDQNLLHTFDISHFFSCIQHLSHSLQKLSITDGNGGYNFTNFEETQAFNFPELSYLSIQGRTLPSLPEIENIIKLVQVKPNASNPQIKLKRIRIDSCKVLLELFNSLKKISGKQIELMVFYENKEDDDEYFKENYEEVKRNSGNLRNVSLDLRFLVSSRKFRWMKELKLLEGLLKNLILKENVYA